MPTAAILQETSTSNGAVAAGTIVKAFALALTPGSYLRVVCSGDSGAVASFGCQDPTNGPYTLVDTNVNATDGVRMAQFVVLNSASTAVTVTITPNASAEFLGIWIQEIGGVSGWDSPLGHVMNLQPAPGSGANAVSSGNLTPSTQPGLLVALTADTSGLGGTLTAGTGFTSGAAGWNFGSAGNSALSESLHYITTTAKAATFTTGNAGDNYMTAAMLFIEGTSGGGSTFPPLPGLGPTDQRLNALLRAKSRARAPMHCRTFEGTPAGLLVPRRRIFLPSRGLHA